MKKVIRALKEKLGQVYTGLLVMQNRARRALAGNEGQFVADNAVVVVIIVAVGAVALVVLIGFLQSDLAPAVKDKILDFLN